MTKEKLEKENAELKEQNRNYEQLIDNGSVTLAKERLKNYKQLTKAKEIIKEFVFLLTHTRTALDTKTVMQKAEQFLKDENIILEDAQVGNSPFDADEVFNKEMKAYPEGKVK